LPATGIQESFWHQKPVLQKARKPFGLQYKILKLDSNEIEQTETAN
jgi:hypothetical protein